MIEHLCPFCNAVLKSSTGADRIAYKCAAITCNAKPFCNYVMVTDMTGLKLSVSIRVQLEEAYLLTIGYEHNTTSIEKLKIIPNEGSEDYCLPIDMIWLNESVAFDFNNPKESAIKIINRFLRLKAFI